MDKYEYRFSAVCGLERRERYYRYWQRVTGVILEGMTASELRHCADIMDSALKTSNNK